MGYTVDQFKIEIKGDDNLEEFINLWNNYIIEEEYADYEMEEILDYSESEIQFNDGVYSLEFEAEGLFNDWGCDIWNTFFMKYIIDNPNVQIKAKYLLDNTGEFSAHFYEYKNNKFIVTDVWDLYQYCYECDEEISVELCDNSIVAKCINCEYDIDILQDVEIERFELTLQNGVWDKPNGFSFCLDSDLEFASSIDFDDSKIPEYVLNKDKSADTGIIKAMIDKDTVLKLKDLNIVPAEPKRYRIDVDLIDMPFSFSIIPEEASGDITINIYLRQVYETDEVDGIIKWNPATGDNPFVDVVCSNDVAEQVKSLALITNYVLFLWLSDSNKFRDYYTTDLELEHLLIYSNGEEVDTKIVYGTQRPDLMANGLIGDYEYVRPCANEKELIEERN